MNKKEEEFKKRFLATFKIEANEHLKAISSGLLELEKVKNINKTCIAAAAVEPLQIS